MMTRLRLSTLICYVFGHTSSKLRQCRKLSDLPRKDPSLQTLHLSIPRLPVRNYRTPARHRVCEHCTCQVVILVPSLKKITFMFIERDNIINKEVFNEWSKINPSMEGWRRCSHISRALLRCILNDLTLLHCLLQVVLFKFTRS